MDVLTAIGTLSGLLAIPIAAVVAVIVGRRRGLEQVDQRTDAEIGRLVDAQAARLLLLEAENKRQAEQMAEQRRTIDTLTTEQKSLRSKVEELELALARERRVTAGMRGETA